VPNLREFTNAVTLVSAATQHVTRRLKADLAAQDRVTLVVSGGRSPVPLFKALAKQSLAWERVTVTLADERWVAPDEADSNEALVRGHLLKHRAAEAAFVPFWTGTDTPEAAVPVVAAALAELPHPFSLVLLGMGEDGHMASLFPGAETLVEGLTSEASVVAVRPPQASHRRLSLSLHALLDSREILLMISGTEKRRILEKALDEGSVETCPIRAILRQTVVPVSVFWAP
jgi:6-phosphogluconolactonase